MYSLCIVSSKHLCLDENTSRTAEGVENCVARPSVVLDEPAGDLGNHHGQVGMKAVGEAFGELAAVIPRAILLSKRCIGTGSGQRQRLFL